MAGRNHSCFGSLPLWMHHGSLTKSCAEVEKIAVPIRHCNFPLVSAVDWKEPNGLLLPCAVSPTPISLALQVHLKVMTMPLGV